VLPDDIDALRRAKRLDAERADLESAPDVEALPAVVRCSRGEVGDGSSCSSVAKT
jgi:hypothetical protein